MTTTAGTTGRVVVSVAAWSVLFIAVSAPSQTSPYERTFPQSKTTIEKALVGLQSSLAGVGPLFFLDCLALYGWQYGCASTIHWTAIRALPRRRRH